MGDGGGSGIRRKFEDDERKILHEESTGLDLEHLYSDVEFFDDVNGGSLDKALMVEARKLETVFFRRLWLLHESKPFGGLQSRRKGHQDQVGRHKQGR